MRTVLGLSGLRDPWGMVPSGTPSTSNNDTTTWLHDSISAKNMLYDDDDDDRLLDG